MNNIIMPRIDYETEVPTSQASDGTTRFVCRSPVLAPATSDDDSTPPSSPLDGYDYQVREVKPKSEWVFKCELIAKGKVANLWRAYATILRIPELWGEERKAWGFCSKSGRRKSPSLSLVYAPPDEPELVLRFATNSPYLQRTVCTAMEYYCENIESSTASMATDIIDLTGDA